METESQHEDDPHTHGTEEEADETPDAGEDPAVPSPDPDPDRSEESPATQSGGPGEGTGSPTPPAAAR